MRAPAKILRPLANGSGETSAADKMGKSVNIFTTSQANLAKSGHLHTIP
jgi:hypothetical protein